MIIMGLDYGERRIGLAVCDELEIAAHALPTVERNGAELDRIAELLAERQAECIVVGLPLRMDGTDGPASRRVRGFMKALRRHVPGVDLVTMDERLTTAQAHAALSAMGAKMRYRRKNVDGMAAQIILQRYIDRRAVQRKAAERD
jgi:putative Holliday junction resolvase